MDVEGDKGEKKNKKLFTHNCKAQHNIHQKRVLLCFMHWCENLQTTFYASDGVQSKLYNTLPVNSRLGKRY